MLNVILSERQSNRIRGFKSHRGPHNSMAPSSSGRTPGVRMIVHGRRAGRSQNLDIAQLVEQSPCKRYVAGSKPAIEKRGGVTGTLPHPLKFHTYREAMEDVNSLVALAARRQKENWLH